MDLNPKSPFSGKPLSDIDAREGDAWCAQLCGWSDFKRIKLDCDYFYYRGRSLFASGRKSALQNIPNFAEEWEHAGPLMERDEWPHHWRLDPSFTKIPNGLWHVTYFNEIKTNGEDYWPSDIAVSKGDNAPLAIRNAFIIAATHAKLALPQQEVEG